ncbi:PI-PLC X domain-containing protein 2 [Tribolium castaneum]|uniref:PI-PLC X domain-containing protein 3-like Protein n=1 Tax=Tribolium castaneum TaxID=7070 RepID=D6WW39_TRICA|nr:PREDICTED: PI-PLC X domain-containing protein 3 [Tribolium castaneum]EFA08660.1 PI-PLC X domain-containing protein 3-like Protein [Tribolium castaneum]|eukprot:XP_968842.1 PREDICTED: PI-PLC X domain-containing protein 3 [Tribolium castaneum]
MLSQNLEFWMSNLPQSLRQLPLIHLAIPGSHDSTTFAITKKSKISPDARNPIQYLKFLEPLLCPIMVKWSKTQSVNVIQQLNAGIRYFDLRIATKKGCGGFYFVHNLYSECVNGALAEIGQFLNTHKGEVVILDCQHFFNMGAADHCKFISLLVDTFGAKIQPRTDLTQLTLLEMTERGKQVIIIYRSDLREDFLWPGGSFPTPWADTVFVPKLISFLNQTLKSRNYSLGFVSQCVLTPTVWYVCKNIFSSLVNKCVLPLETAKYDWIRRQRAGPKGVNIVISDFIDYQDYRFCKEVIDLNEKILNVY